MLDVDNEPVRHVAELHRAHLWESRTAAAAAGSSEVLSIGFRVEDLEADPINRNRPTTGDDISGRTVHPHAAASVEQPPQRLDANPVPCPRDA